MIIHTRGKIIKAKK